VSQLEFQFEPPARLTKQCASIVARLQKGPATNTELSSIALRYSARIFELRKAGYQIEIISRDDESGVCLYSLTKEPKNENVSRDTTD